MLREIRQVLRLIQLMGKQRKRSSLKNTGALLVLLWTEKGSSHQRINCTVATAGSWCFGIAMHTLQADLKKVLLPGAWPCPEPDPEELSAFTDLYGSLKFLLNFQMKNPGLYSSKWQAHVKAFLQTFGLTNAGIRIQLKFKIHGQKSQHDFSAFLISKVALSVRPPLILDVTCSAQPWCDQRGSWCQKGHPVVGERFPLSIPPKAMDQGLFGELSVQIVTLLSPCVLQYPHLPTELSRMQVLVFSPSNIPVSAPSGFFQTLPVALDYQHLGLDRMHCRSSKAFPDDPVHGDGVVFTVGQENWDDPEQEPSHLPVQQSLLLLLFLQHSDPFTSELTDKMDCELLLELHLEDILSNNRQAVTSALQAELFNTMKALKERKKKREKLQSAAEVIISSTISIVSSSSNMDFRSACLKRMKVHDTHGLSASLRESLWRVSSWKRLPKAGCYSAQQVEDQAASNEAIRAEM
ncbi:type 2 DNA topoisomerase 6 subunit B-like isoform X3 [Xiphophorus couchianus]|uniref:type 2 DNA topoisomerase 6 subunit B-like isoform X3 n=1 Tax=Xiphophorus couchianus TaxID=32473 RepID=UPI001016FF43|nr:type 2 DNA topoisomerase 6 subunit B-like isoform X3 [Xiphophorus couchianus]